MTTIRALALTALFTAAGATTAFSQPVGTFRWQLQPYCNVLSLQVVQQAGIYRLDGTDDQCGGAQLASVVGLAFQNPNGTIGLGLTTVTAPGATPVHIDASITVATVNGTWKDSAGNNGTFIFTPGGGTGGPPRPVLPGGLPPGSITALQIALGAIGAPQLAANSVSGANVINGSLTTADLLDAPRVAFASGEQEVVLTSADAVVRSVTVTTPAPGRLIVNASGYFKFSHPANVDTGRCSITTGSLLDSNHLILAEESAASAMKHVPFGATRGFNVLAGSLTINLVCDQFSGDVAVADTSLTAMFVPQ